jgi:hypothetical protein
VANPKVKKEEAEIEAVPEVTPVGTAFSHLSPEGLRAEYLRVHGKPATPEQSLLELITELMFQFELQKTLAYQDEIYNELNHVVELPND